MERLSLTIHLGVLAGILVFSAAALYALHLRSSRTNSVFQLFLQPETGIKALKCMMDVILVILLSLKVSPVGHLLEEGSLFVAKFLIRVSLTCVMAAEVCWH